MARICLETEKNLSNKYDDKDVSILSPIDALSHSACVLAEDIGAKAIVVCSRSGGTARKVSRFRPTIDIIGMTIEPQSYRKLALSWGVTPVLSEEFTSMDVLFYHAKRAAIDTASCRRATHRHHGRQPERQVGQFERHQHRTDLTALDRGQVKGTAPAHRAGAVLFFLSVSVAVTR